MYLLKCLDKSLLQDIFGIIGIVQEACSNAVHAIAILIVKLQLGLPVVLPAPLYQVNLKHQVGYVSVNCFCYPKDETYFWVLQKPVFLGKFFFSSLKQVTINNKHLSLKVLDYGARIQELLFRDKEGIRHNTVVGLETPEAYLEDDISLGACVGRFAGRISGGGFTLDGSFYPLYTEEGVHLHGGKEGLAYKYWEIREVQQGTDPFVKLAYRSPHLEEGYPGNLEVQVTYQLLQNTLKITHEATTDRLTVVNLTNHSYFRLDDRSSVDHYELQLGSQKFLETHPNLVPTGNLADVKGTDYDFLTPKTIGKTRFDTPFALNGQFVSKVSSPISGIRMQVSTNQPAVVVFTPPWFAGICFETQNFPDAPNVASFPSPYLKPGERYSNSTEFTFDLVP